MIRFKMAMLVVIARLSWGRLIDPIYQRKLFVRFFPTPRKSVYKKALADYFFKN